MMLPDLRTRETKAAQRYMSHKGYPNIRPMGVIPIEEDDCWYYYYDLPEGVLELEVCACEGEWKYMVTCFRIDKMNFVLEPQHSLLVS